MRASHSSTTRAADDADDDDDAEAEKDEEAEAEAAEADDAGARAGARAGSGRPVPMLVAAMFWRQTATRRKERKEKALLVATGP